MCSSTAKNKLSIKNVIQEYNQQRVSSLNESIQLLETIYQYQTDQNILFGNIPVPTLLRPHFLSTYQNAILEEVTHVIMNMLEKIITLYFEKNMFHQIIQLNSYEKELAAIDPGFKRCIMNARLDAFLNDTQLSFIEFNCDSPAGHGYSELQCQIFHNSKLLDTIKQSFHLLWINRRKRMLAALLEAYKQFGGNQSNPHIVITDWHDVKTIHEFYILKDYFESQGFPTTVADPRELTIVKNKLCIHDKPIDIIYRRVIVKEIVSKQDEVKDFLSACKNKLVCVVNSFRSKVISNKSTLAILTDPQFDHLFTKQENEIKYKHIPWTRNLSPGNVLYENKQVDLFEYAGANKDKFVIKPADGYGGIGVYIGKYTPEAQWKDCFEMALKDPYVIQEYVDIPEEEFPVINENATITIENRKVNLNPFAIAGQYAGCLSRISQSPVINVSAGGGMVPTFLLNEE
jgi:uncharacterized circularly permuted ATP-grasp superfamily protein